MKISVETITPNEASIMINRSAGQPQRRLNLTRVSQLADAIKRGQWQLNHQPIAVDADGVVFDGQHRLHAIVEADMPVEVTVARDADPTTFMTIDLRGTRTAANTLHIAGYTDTNVLAASARLLLMIDRYQGTRTVPTGAHRTAITNQDVLDLLESDRGAIMLSRIRPASALSLGVGQNGTKTPFVVAQTLLTEAGAPDDLQEAFFGAIESGAMLDASSPMFTLRRWLIQSYAFSDRGNRSYMVVALIIRAWNAWIQGDTPGYLRFLIGRESFPTVIPNRAAVDLEALEREAFELEEA